MKSEFILVIHISNFEDLISVNFTKSYLQISVLCADNIQISDNF